MSKKLLARSRAILLALMVGVAYASAAPAQTVLANLPVFAISDVPGNLALALSVEFPTAISVANIGAYYDSSEFLGYFDPRKCYDYTFGGGPASSYFYPVGLAGGTYSHTCSGHWSGNFMNWATMQTIDPFRWALTGGYRAVDTSNTTILEKAWGSAQGGVSNFPDRGTGFGGANNLPNASTVTPFSNWPGFNFRIWSNGNAMVFSGSGGNYGTSVGSATDLSSVSTANTAGNSGVGYKVYVRVKVCDPALLESNCVQYGSNYKPEGLIQQYSNKIRFSMFSYLNQDGYNQQGAVMRESMNYVGPTYHTPLNTTPITNPVAEWDGTTGIMNTNPDPTAASASGVSQSGVMNFLNKFGEFSHSYMTYDNVSELYYAVVRYYENLGNVPEWTNGATTTGLDGFPAIASWNNNTIPSILYSCQKNFILGMGDDHTWFDYNVGGNTNASGPRPKPSAVQSDTFNQASAWTTALQNLEGISPTPWWPFDSGATYFMAGLAYGVHVNDIRSDLPDAQTISTYWMDVAEYQHVEDLNPYYLAAKYGGFTTPNINAAPTATPYNMSTALTQSQWDTTGAIVNMTGNNHPLPDNYFVTGSAQAMVNGLTSAFSSISSKTSLLTTSFSFASPNVTNSSNTESFNTLYKAKDWSGTITGNSFMFDAAGNPTGAFLWSTDTTLQAQVSGMGWKTGRNIATWNGSAGVPFEYSSLTSAQQAALVPSYASGLTCSGSTNPGLCYLEYLRGDQEDEIGSSGPSPSLRARNLFLGDIVNAGLTPVVGAIQNFSESTNPGYAAFKSSIASRQSMVYAAANDGMLHAFVGATGAEQFAYVPSFMFQGPNNTPQVDGLAQLGNPNYNHHFYVDATPYAFDIDFNRAGTAVIPSTHAWHTILIGGLGKGGKGFYALDVTDPASMNSESAVAAKVLWEFTDPTVPDSMGYSYGAPVVIKTAKLGWVVVLTSGYNNPVDGSGNHIGYIYIVNPVTGVLIQRIATPSVASMQSVGLTQASGYVQDYSDGTADSIYVGDLGGLVWRFDLTGTPPYLPPVLMARLTAGDGTAQPVTSAPLIEIHPVTRRRYLMIGTGKLLDSTDIISSQMQTFYAIFDGTASAFVPSAMLSTPIVRSNLQPYADTDIVNINTIGATYKGWYYDLGVDSVSGIAYRVLVNPQAYNGIVAFSSLLTSPNACSSSGTSRVYALDYSTATSVLQPTPVAFDTFNQSVIDLRFVANNGNPELIVGFSAGTPPYARVPANLTGTLATRILNWREIPTVE